MNIKIEQGYVHCSQVIKAESLHQGVLLPEELFLWAQKTAKTTRRALRRRSIPLAIDRDPVHIAVQAYLAKDMQSGTPMALVIPRSY